jgi:putative protease
MVSEYCVIGSTFGGKSNNKGCTYDCGRNAFSLKDRMGEEFRVITDKFCRSHIYNNVPVNLIPHIKELRKNKINNFRVDFIDENEKEVREILQMVMDEEYIGEYKNYTRGHYKRGVE